MREKIQTQEIKTHPKSEPIFSFNKKIVKKENEIKEYFSNSISSRSPQQISSEKPPQKNKEKLEIDCLLTPRVLSSPLGSISKTVPLNNWTPLASISGTRPNVDKFSPSRFSPEENGMRFESLLKANESSFYNASLSAFTALKSMEKAFAESEKDSLYNNMRLSSRAGVLFKWKLELERDILDLNAEIKLILDEKKRLQKSIRALALVKSINNEMKSNRCLRMESELVRDQVDEEVFKEATVCEDISNIYKRCENHLNLHLQELKDTKQRLECDWSRKENAYDIESTCIGLKNNSSNILWKPESIKLPQNQSSLLTYEQFFKESLAQSRDSLRKSKILRINMKNIYESSVQDLRKQADKIDFALDEKIEETIKHCYKLDNDLKRCIGSMSETEALINKINNNIRKLDGFMKCTQTRLNERLHREFIENCCDAPQFGLIESAKSLTENLTNILAQRTRAEEALNELIKTRKEVEKELMIKQNTLCIDRDRCRSIRSFYPSVQCLVGY